MIWKCGRRSVTNHLEPLGKNGVLVTISFLASRKEGAEGGRGGEGGCRTRLLTTEYSTSRTCQARCTS